MTLNTETTNKKTTNTETTNTEKVNTGTINKGKENRKTADKEKTGARINGGWRQRAVLFFVSQSITLFGTQIVQMAVVWYITLSTSSGAWAAAFSVCSYLPQFLLSFPGGEWADRYRRKRLIIGADVMTAAVTAVVFCLLPGISSEQTTLWVLLAMCVIRSAGAGIQSPAVNAAIPGLVPGKHLMRYNGINAAMQSAVQFAAPAAAGAVLSAGSLRTTLLIDVFTAAAGVGILAFVSVPGPEKAHRNQNQARRNRKNRSSTECREERSPGIPSACVRGETGGLLILYGAFTFLCVPAGYLSGLFVSRTYGNSYLYLTATEVCGFGGMTAGGMLMAAAAGRWAKKQKKPVLSAGLALFGAASAGMGIAENFGLYLALMTGYGIALTVVQTTITTLLQENSDAASHGRIFGRMSAVYAFCYPAGMAVFGPLADEVPLPWIMAGAGGLLICMAALVMWRK